MIQNPMNISSGDSIIVPLYADTNKTYTAPSGVDGYNPVTVNVESGDLPPAAGNYW